MKSFLKIWLVLFLIPCFLLNANEHIRRRLSFLPAIVVSGNEGIQVNRSDIIDDVIAEVIRREQATGEIMILQQLHAICWENASILADKQMFLLEAEKNNLMMSKIEAQREIRKIMTEDPEGYKSIIQKFESEEEAINDMVKNVSIQRYLHYTTSARIRITDAEITRFYNENLNIFTTPERRSVLKMSLKDEIHSAKGRQKMSHARGLWTNNVAPEKMTEILGREVIGPQKTPQLAVKGADRSEASKVIFEAKVGTVTEPVKDEEGWAIYKIVQIFPEEVQSLEDSREAIRNHLATGMKTIQVQRLIEELRKKYNVKFNF